MKHDFPVDYKSVGLASLANVQTIRAWKSAVEKLAKSNNVAPRFDVNNFKGMAFEHLVEAVIAYKGTDSRVAIVNYAPAAAKYNTGIDGYGMFSMKPNLPHTVQVKYRGNRNALIENKVGEALGHKTLKENWGKTVEPPKMTIFTTADGPSPNFEKNHQDINVIGYKGLAALINKDMGFWAFYANDLLNRA